MDSRVRGEALSLLLSGVLTIFLASCGHRKSAPEPQNGSSKGPEAPLLENSALGAQLTEFGENHSPFLSPDGRFVAFISKARNQHPQGQVYLFDMESLKERRLTFQDGECFDPVFIDKHNSLVFASSTDELKERPVLFYKDQNSQPLPPTELYLTDVFGSSFTRLTTQFGFDGFPWPFGGDDLLYSRLKGKDLEILRLNLQRNSVSSLATLKDLTVKGPRPSLDGKAWAWIESQSQDLSQVFVGQRPLSAQKQVLSLPQGDYKEAVWLNDQTLILNARIFKKNYQFYQYDLKTQCLSSLFESEQDVFSPRIDNQRKRIVFTGVSQKRSHLYSKKMATSNTCLKWPN